MPCVEIQEQISPGSVLRSLFPLLFQPVQLNKLRLQLPCGCILSLLRQLPLALLWFLGQQMSLTCNRLTQATFHMSPEVLCPFQGFSCLGLSFWSLRGHSPRTVTLEFMPKAYINSLSSNFKLQEEVSLGVTHFLHLRLSQCPLPLPSHQFIQHV